ncbi:MAG: zraS 6 [Verrucomicrobia bacterium]|nr:zraS 6 [Verrucomicrobiota bacterium]
MNAMNFSALVPFVAALCAGMLAILVALRAKRSIADWALAAGLATLAVESLFTGWTASAPLYGEIMRWQTGKLAALSLVPGFWLLFSLTYARGNAHDFVSRWRTILLFAFTLPVALVAFFHQQLIGSLVDSDSGLHLQLGLPGFILHLTVLIASVVIIMNLERTFRASVGTMRWRIKFMLLGVGLLFIARAYTSSQATLSRTVELPLSGIDSAALLVAVFLALRSLFRSGQLALDVYPSQSVLQGSLTILLAGIYLLFVGVLAKIAAYLGGDSSFALKAFIILLSLVLLAVLLQSDRVRLHVRRFVSRNFQRPLYDYRTVWRKFTEGTAAHVEQADLCRSLAKLTAEVFAALSVAIWLVDDKKEKTELAASTFPPDSSQHDLALNKAETAAALTFFKLHPDPVSLERQRDIWGRALRLIHPTQFPNGGDRVCLPIIAHGEVVGLISLGDRVGGAAFSLQDFDMLKCVGDHVAASLLNVQLSQRLLQAKEMEAFQTMAAFFVHDMKNAASTLNLMLQNLPIHFNDPAFREDALRGVSKTVTHMNHLIGRLSMLRHELKIQPSVADLNQVVTSALGGLDSGPNLTVIKDLAALEPFPFDRDQVAKVITNLVLNSREAMTGKGEIKVSTREENAWVILTVVDNGSGMSPDYVRKSLFKPFQTTKKSGLGIGMFQSKMIVEAHGGRIAVFSEVGKGTTFEVWLPQRAA